MRCSGKEPIGGQASLGTIQCIRGVGPHSPDRRCWIVSTHPSLEMRVELLEVALLRTRRFALRLGGSPLRLVGEE
jgi:hypothetical protein